MAPECDDANKGNSMAGRKSAVNVIPTLARLHSGQLDQFLSLDHHYQWIDWTAYSSRQMVSRSWTSFELLQTWRCVDVGLLAADQLTLINRPR